MPDQTPTIDDQVISYFQNNPADDVTTFDFTNTAAIDQLPWDGGDKDATITELRAIQRVMRLYPDFALARTLVAANLDSAQKIAALPKSEFAALYKSATHRAASLAQPATLDGDGTPEAAADAGQPQLNDQIAEQIHKNSVEVKARTLHLWANLQSTLASPYTRMMRVNNFRLDDADALVTSLPSYQKIFGTLNYCDCSECKSIFGAAAYLVDLLRIVDEHITKLNSNIPKNWALDQRRPDIGKLPLTCENTNTLLSYLQIVNETLQGMVKTLLALPDGTDVFQTLANRTYPFNLPFHLPLAQIRAVLAQLNTDLLTVYRLFGDSDTVQTREALGLSIEEYTLITTPVPATFQADDIQKLKDAYGLTQKSDLTALQSISTFMAQTGLSLDELNTLLFQNLGKAEKDAGLCKQFYINQGSSSCITISDSNPDMIANLSNPALHRINRFIRLAKKLKWSFIDLDWALNVIGGDDPLVSGLSALARIKQFSERFTIAIDSASSFLGDMKTLGMGDSGPSQALFDSVFNNPSLLNGKLPYHPKAKAETAYAKNPLYTDYSNGPLTWQPDHPEILANTQNAGRIAAGLRLKQNDLTLLAQAYFVGTIDLTVPNLSILYRHAKLAALLGLKIDQYLLLLKLIGKNNLPLPSAADLGVIVNAADWLKGSGLTVYQLDYIINDGSQSFVSPKYTYSQGSDDANLKQFLRSIWALIKTPALQADAFVSESINESLSADYFNQLVSLKYVQNGILIVPATTVQAGDLDATGKQVISAVQTTLQAAHASTTALQAGSFVSPDPNKISLALSGWIFTQLINLQLIDSAGNLTAKYGNGDALDLSFITTYLNAQVNATLVTFAGVAEDRKNKLIEQLATFLGSQTDTIAEVAEIAAAATAAQLSGAPNYVEAFLAQPPHPATDDSPYLTYIRSFLTMASHWLMLVEPVQLSPSEISAIRTWSTTFGIKSFADKLTFGSIADIVMFKQLITTFGDTHGGFVELLATIGGLTANLLSRGVDKLVGVTGWDSGQTTFLIQTFYSAATDAASNDPQSDTTLVRHLVRLKRSFDLGRQLGVTMQFLQNINTLSTLSSVQAADWQTYLSSVDAITSSVKAHYDDDAWATAYGAINQQLDEQKRNVLLGITLWQLPQQPPESNYGAICNARNLSEYLLIDVEMSGCAQISRIVQALASVQQYLQRCRLNLESGVTNLDIPPIWWEWMMNYRIWEANRKVFLYPENYLDPSLRRSKTTLFKDLESQLLQSDISATSVEDAYRKYIEDFSQLAKLQYVDGYRCLVNDPVRGQIDTTFLFARTETEPYTYYYCTLENNQTDTSQTPGCTQQSGKTWTEWQKIDIAIASAYITPVYAFSKLFLFWVELKQSSSSTIEASSGTGSKSTSNRVYKTNIKFSFYNFHGRWIQPQTLISDQIAYFVSSDPPPNPLDTALPFKDTFEMDDLYWNKVYALRVSPDSYPGGTQYGPNAEKISIVYGPLLATDSTLPPTVNNLQDDKDPDRSMFTQQLYTSAVVLKSAMTTSNLAYFPQNKVLTLNTELQYDSVIQNNEFLLLSKTAPGQTPLLFKPEIDSVHGTLAIVNSDSALQSNYFGDITPVVSVAQPPSPLNVKSFVTGDINEDLSNKIYATLGTYKIVDPATGMVAPTFNSSLPLAALLGSLVTAQQAQAVQNVLFSAMGDPLLFGKISKQNAQTITIKNQPNWFILDNGDEAFMLEPKLNPYKRIADSLAAAPPLIYTNSFIGGTINAQKSNSVYAVLTTYTIVDPSTGRVNLGSLQAIDLKMIMGSLLSDHELRVVRNILYNYPIIQPSSLMEIGVPAATSQGIYATLNTYQLIDDAGRVSLDLIPSIDISTVLQGPGLALSPKQIGKVRNMLFGAPALMYLNYVPTPSSTGMNNLHDYTFATTRLTTGAINNLSRKLFTGGINGLLALDSQQTPVQPQMPFDRLMPSPVLTPPTAVDGTQVDFDGPYGNYYWEIFFHVPWLIAMRLAGNQQFDDAQKWLQYIFNPTISEQFLQADSFSSATKDIDAASSSKIYQDLKTNAVLPDSAGKKPIIDGNGRVSPDFTSQTDLSFLRTSQAVALTLNQTREVRNLLLNFQLATPMSCYWNFQPFRNRQLQTLLCILSDTDAIKRWNDDPFDPHAIAALRIGAYEKAIVMQYIDVLIDWGDYMFGQDSWESITQATLLYTYAYDLLGPRPQNLGPCKSRQPANFNQIKALYPDGIPQFLIDLEHHLPSSPSSAGVITSAGKPFNDLDTYFCIPENTQFTAYWDRVEDRLFKIRNCMNLAGITRQLALFQPPIDPMQLVRAAASGTGALATLSAGQQNIPHYRFMFMLERAKSLANQLSIMGSSLLSALEKKDIEDLTMLRQTQEESLLNLTTVIKQRQIDQLQQHLAALQQNQQMAQIRLDHYTALIDKGYSAAEIAYLTTMTLAMVFNAISGVMKTAAAIGYAVPQVGSPFAMTYGGQQIGNALTATGAFFEILGSASTFASQVSATVGEYQRREEEWRFQQQLAQYEVQQITNEISAMTTGIAIANQELTIHTKNIQQAKEVEDFLKRKFTNSDLYQWMVDRIAAVYFQTYKIALDMAVAAQKGYQYELDRDDTFITMQYWDSLKRGLLAGEGLLFALNQLERAYIDNNVRRLEIEKTISLLQLQPMAFLQLKLNGRCTFTLDESTFDYDFPGHYSRQIKSLAISIPAIVSPYQNIKATLIQTSNAVVVNANPAVVEFLLDQKQGTPPTSGLRENWAPNQQVAISKGVDDSGMFVLDFKEDRYLPFEGTGAVSSWELRLPKQTNRIDFDSLNDVIIQLRYTALPGGDAFQQAVQSKLASRPATRSIYASMKQAFSVAWSSFMNSAPSADTQSFNLAFIVDSRMILPNFSTVQLQSVALRLVAPNKINSSKLVSVKIGSENVAAITLADNIGTLGNLALGRDQFVGQPWTIAVASGEAAALKLASGGHLDPNAFQNIEIILTYAGCVFGDTPCQ